MFDLLATGPFVPFTLSLAILFGLLALELILALLGGTVLGLGADADLDLEVDLEADAPDLSALNIDFGDTEADLFEFAEPEPDGAVEATVSAGPASWLGIGKVPVLIWLAAVLLAFGLTGLVLQNVALAILGRPLWAGLAALPAALAALWFASSFAAVFARLLPKTETTALSARHLGRRTGVVTQGVARRGKPSEVRVTDRYGNTHYLRAEPLRDEVAIPAGTHVLVLRHRLDDGYRLVPLSDIS